MISGEEMLKWLKKPIIIMAAIIILLLCFLFGFLGYKIGANKQQPIENQIDTVRITETHYITEYKFDTTKLFVYKPYKVIVHDTVYPEDTTDVDIKYIEGMATIPDTLSIWYHGWIDAGIDSVKYSLFKTTEIVNHTIEVPKYVTPRFMFNAGLGFCYNQEPFAYAIGKASYNQKYSTYSLFGGYGTNFEQSSPFFGAEVTLRLDIQ